MKKLILEYPKIRCYSLLEIFFSRTGLGTIIYFSIYALYSRLVFVHSYQLSYILLNRLLPNKKDSIYHLTNFCICYLY